jgi:LL-diaminopimelate aminotransferase
MSGRSTASVDPDIRPPQVALDALQAALVDPKVQDHRLPIQFNGLPEFRSAIAGWSRHRFGVGIDGEKEALALVGSKEGIASSSSPTSIRATRSCCTPCYPAYLGVAALAQVRTIEVPLLAANRLPPRPRGDPRG